eukprot:5879992-Pyramimonas_sp.AAC.1
MHSLSSAWLTKADKRRLDGFQARCLRSILGVKHPYISRASSKAILERSGQTPYTSQLLVNQLAWFGK